VNIVAGLTMDTSRIFAVVGVVVLAMLAVQADAALTFESSSEALALLQPSMPAALAEPAAAPPLAASLERPRSSGRTRP
jgi:hypothetical protein